MVYHIVRKSKDTGGIIPITRMTQKHQAFNKAYDLKDYEPDVDFFIYWITNGKKIICEIFNNAWDLAPEAF